MALEIEYDWQRSVEMANAALGRGDFERAAQWYSAALNQAYDAYAPEAEIAQIFMRLADTRCAQGELQDAQRIYRQALATFERSCGPESLAVGTVCVALGKLLCQMNQANQAELLFARGLQILKQVYGENSAEVRTFREQVARLLEMFAPKETHSIQGSENQARVSSAATVKDPSINLDVTRSQRSLKRALAATRGESSVYVAPSVTLGDGVLDITALIHPREKFYGNISRAVGWVFYALFCLVGLLLAPIGLLGIFVSSGIHMGAIRSSGIKVGPEQFPEINRLVEEYSAKLGIIVPEVYIIHEENLLNAYAMKFHGRDFVVISASVVEMAYRQGEQELAFVLCHELTHVKRQHMKWGWLHTPAACIPFFSNAYSRACEYTCDRVATALVPDGALFGLVALAAGTDLYRRVNLEILYEQADSQWNFWTWYHEVDSSHPNLVNRIRAIGIADDRARRQMSGSGLRGDQLKVS